MVLLVNVAGELGREKGHPAKLLEHARGLVDGMSHDGLVLKAVELVLILIGPYQMVGDREGQCIASCTLH